MASFYVAHTYGANKCSIPTHCSRRFLSYVHCCCTLYDDDRIHSYFIVLGVGSIWVPSFPSWFGINSRWRYHPRRQKQTKTEQYVLVDTSYVRTNSCFKFHHQLVDTLWVVIICGRLNRSAHKQNIKYDTPRALCLPPQLSTKKNG